MQGRNCDSGRLYNYNACDGLGWNGRIKWDTGRVLGRGGISKAQKMAILKGWVEGLFF